MPSLRTRLSRTHRKKIQYVFLFAAGLAVFVYVFFRHQKPQAWSLDGTTMGVVAYQVRYIAPEAVVSPQGVDSILTSLNAALSTYLPSSEISRFNRDDTLVFKSPFFLPVLEESLRVHALTQGAFDPTMAPLVNAWGFGPSGQPTQDTLRLDSLRALVGIDLFRYTQQAIGKRHKGVALDFSAIAKGYAVDLVADYVETSGVFRYMVEIGGEIRVRGENAENKPWRIGLQDPLRPAEAQAACVLGLREGAVATSGNYRNFHASGSTTFGHILDPRTGRPAQNSLWSVSVWAPTCMRADAVATGCLVMGLADATALIEREEALEAVFFYTDSLETGMRTYLSAGMKEHLLP